MNHVSHDYFENFYHEHLRLVVDRHAPTLTKIALREVKHVPLASLLNRCQNLEELILEEVVYSTQDGQNKDSMKVFHFMELAPLGDFS